MSILLCRLHLFFLNMSNFYMKNLLVIGCIVISFTYTHAQQKEQFQFDHKAIYEVTYLVDSLDQDSKKQEMTELLIGDGTSLFRSFQKASDDSSYRAYIRNKVITMSEPIVTSVGDINAFNYQVLKDFSSGQTKVYDEYTGGSLGTLKEIAYYFEPQEAMSDWALKEDTATINGHLCQRADIEFGGRIWTAWFSPEMAAYSDGPYKFRGLPGLIFRVHDAKKTWDFELVDFSKIDTLISINFKEDLSFKETSKEDIFKNRRDFQKNQVEINEAAGTDYGDSKKDVKKKLEEYILHDNNWIELYH